MSSFSFLHAADLHLDSPLKGLERHDGLPTERIRDASRRALDRMIDTAIANNVAFVVIAGDLYDGSWKTVSTGRYMAAALGRLRELGIRVFLLQGNHDAASVLSKDLPLPEGVDRFPSHKSASFTIESLGVALHGQSFATRHVPDDMTPSYPAPMEGYFNIGVLHTSLSGHGGPHETYAPSTVQGLRAKGYDYWALGHVHQRMILDGGTPIVYPGVLQGRHIRETGEKGIILVTVENHAITAIEPVSCDVVRWHETRFDCTGIEEQAEFEHRLERHLNDVGALCGGMLCVIRLILHGETPLDDLLKRQGPTLRETVQHLIAMSGSDIELEKLVVETCSPTNLHPQDGSTGRLSGEEIVALADLIRQTTQDETFLADISKDLNLCLGTLNLGKIAPDSLLGQIGRHDWTSILPDLEQALCQRLSDKKDPS